MEYELQIAYERCRKMLTRFVYSVKEKNLRIWW